MEQFRQIGEVVGSLNALMVFQNHLFNKRQCCLLVDMLTSGYRAIAEQIKQKLKFEEKNTKWKIVENPLKEVLRVFREGEAYIKQCLDTKEWWAKAIVLFQNSDCVDFHIHNLLCTLPIAIEAIEMAGQISGIDNDEIQRKRTAYSLKYNKELKNPRMFQFVHGDVYLVSQDLCTRIDSVWDEDRWFLLKEIKDKKKGFTSKRDHRLADVLLKYLSFSAENHQDLLLPSSTLMNSKDYLVRRRLGNGREYKEIQWLGESFALRNLYGDIESLLPDISVGLTLSHPNIQHILCGFSDEESKECFLVMELMQRDLSSYIKEISGTRKRIPFTISVAVDLMLQIARGMEYLHSKKIYHGDLNPYNILIKCRNISPDGYLLAKVSGFGLSSSVCSLTPTNHNGPPSFIWYAPEVMVEQDNGFVDGGARSKYSEKSDVYSFGMICFEVLTGKVPFEDTHLQGDKMSRNIRAGERPLFPFHSPKLITNLTKKCWHTDPAQRPGFTSICRILRYTKRFLVMNPEHSQPDAAIPPMDFSDLEAGLVRSVGSFAKAGMSLSVTQVPFQMFAYRVIERERANAGSLKEMSESGSEGASTCEDENMLTAEEMSSPTDKKLLPCPEVMIRKLSMSKSVFDINTKENKPVTPKGRSVRPPHTPRGRTMRLSSENNTTTMSPRTRRRSGIVSDSELLS
ncbi:hypothetical protein ACS0TY_019635 [Phlomoides rotata]